MAMPQFRLSLRQGKRGPLTQAAEAQHANGCKRGRRNRPESSGVGQALATTASAPASSQARREAQQTSARNRFPLA